MQKGKESVSTTRRSIQSDFKKFILQQGRKKGRFRPKTKYGC